VKTSLILFGLLAGSLYAQTTITASGPQAARPGQILLIVVSATGATDTGAAALQWAFALPAGYSVSQPTTTVVGKGLSCTPDNTLCILWGMNASVVPNGPVSTTTITLPPSLPYGPVTFPLVKLAAAGPTGASVPVIAGPVVSLLVVSPDINGDGKVDASDVQAMLTEVLAAQASGTGTPCPHDQDGDGHCTLLDVMAVILQAK
jgi:hypothetical protein